MKRYQKKIHVTIFKCIGSYFESERQIIPIHLSLDKKKCKTLYKLKMEASKASGVSWCTINEVKGSNSFSKRYVENLIRKEKEYRKKQLEKLRLKDKYSTEFGYIAYEPCERIYQYTYDSDNRFIEIIQEVR